MKFIKLILILLVIFHFNSLNASEDKLYNKIIEGEIPKDKFKQKLDLK